MLQNIFLIAGLYVLFGGIISWYQTSKFFKRCEKIKAVVVSHHYQTSIDNEEKTINSFPIFQYNHPKTGIEYRVRSNVSEHLEKGQEVEILYDPKNPENAKIADLSHSWMIPISVTFLGVFFSFIGILARNTVTDSYGFYDRIILVFLAIVFIFTLSKSLQIILKEPSIYRKY